MAPESLFDRKFYPASDVWSFGVLMWEVFTLGGNPYPTVAVESLFDYLKEGNRMSRPMYGDDRMYALMCECWQFRAEARPSFERLHEKLVAVMRQYEQQAKLIEMEKLYDQHQNTYFYNNNGVFTSSGAAPKVSKSECESDSQYFSGADSSLIYNETSSNNSNYSSSLLTPASAAMAVAVANGFSTFSSASSSTSTPAPLPPSRDTLAAASKTLTSLLKQQPPPTPLSHHFSNLFNVNSSHDL